MKKYYLLKINLPWIDIPPYIANLKLYPFLPLACTNSRNTNYQNKKLILITKKFNSSYLTYIESSPTEILFSHPIPSQFFIRGDTNFLDILSTFEYLQQ